MKSILRRKPLKELYVLEKIIDMFGDLARTEVVGKVRHSGRDFPLYVVELGSEDPEAPAIGYFGGVHGLEKIGSEVILAMMESITSLIKWDESFRKRLKHSRMVFMPIVNPVGIWNGTRSNGNGIDLMRNSPSESGEEARAIYSGHRISPKLPWYRGEKHGDMEVEAQALCKVVKEKLFPSKLSMAIDVHSGFGANDRFWFPYARAKDLYPHIGQVMALKNLFDKTYPHHFYTIEPTSYQYTINGDLWDYLVDEYFRMHLDVEPRQKFFLPWTLEMGSWIWLKKNPFQLLNRFGFYHPILPHRYQRILRRHITLFDFMQRSILFSEPWLNIDQKQKAKYKVLAQEKWYGT